jgi:hypothetical protein
MDVRRFAAALLVGLALLAASVAWGAFTTSFTVFRPGGSERVADVLVEAPAVRDMLAAALAKSLTSGKSDGPQIPGAEVESIARRVLDDPRTLALLRTAVVGAHRRIVGAADGPVQLDMAPVAQAARDALIGAHPELAASLPASPSTVEMPTDKLPKLAPLRGHIGRIGRAAGLAAVWLLLGAFLVASDRPKVLRRAGRWAVGVGLASMATGWLLPSLLSRVENPSLSVIGALAIAVVGPMVVPAVILVAAGAAATVVARAWRTRAAVAVASAALPLADVAPAPLAA